MIELWSTVLEKNSFPPPSRTAGEPLVQDPAALDRVLERVVRRLLPEIPLPHPAVTFDGPSARAASTVVACALGRLQVASRSGPLLLQAMAALPDPATAAQHLTQAAVLWHAVPVARRFLSEAFKTINQGQAGAERKEAIGEHFLSFLARRPLLSLRADTEELFCHSEPPSLTGLSEAPGLRRWVLERLSSPPVDEPSARRQAAAIRRVAATWPEEALREILFLRERIAGPAGAEFLAEFFPMLDRGRWPEDLAPGLRKQAQSSRKPAEEDDHEQSVP